MADDSAYVKSTDTTSASTTSTSTATTSIPVTGGTDDTTGVTATAPAFIPSTNTFNASASLPITVKNLTIEADLNTEVNVPIQVSNLVGTMKVKVDGDLPTGLMINSSTGLIYGTPTGVPTQDIVEVLVYDSNGNVGRGEYTIIVNPPLGATGASSISRTSGLSLNMSIAGSGGTGNYSYSLENPPAGVSIGNTTGAFSGSISTVGATTITAVVDDSVATVRYPIIVNVSAAAPTTTGGASNFTSRLRIATLGMRKLQQAITLRTQNPPEYITSGKCLLDAARKLCQDPSDQFLDMFADTFRKYGGGFLNEYVFFNGMERFGEVDMNLINAVWWGFLQVVYKHNPKQVNWDDFLRYTGNQDVRYYLVNYW